MARPSKTETLASIHATALERFDRVYSATYEDRKQSLRDRRFCDVPGAQWEGALAAQFENKPMFEVNKTQLAVLRIENEYRNNRITADFVPKGGTEYDALADTCDGLFRADEYESGADEAKDNAFSEGLRGGFGAFRLRTEYEYPEDGEDERQRIRFEPIYEADACVFFDCDARRQDKKDAKYCFVLIPMTPKEYESQYGDNPSTWNRGITDSEFDWSTPDLVYVAEYYVVEDSSKKVMIFKSNVTDEEKRYDETEYDEDEDLRMELSTTGYNLERIRKIPTKRVRKYLLSGNKVLEDQGYIAGDRIPIAPFFGKRTFVDGKERFMGHVRHAVDVQRLKNMQLSKLAEISAYSSISKPIFTAEQMAGHQVMWQDDNIKQYPYLLVNSIKDADGNNLPAPPLAYTKPPEIPQALAALLQVTEQDMADILGNQQGADKVVSNISGKAVELIQTRLDMQSYIYMSNFAKTIQCAAEIWLGMAKDVYVEEKRKMKTVGLNGEAGSVELMRPVLGENDEVKLENDLSEAKFDVYVEVGPSYTTQRESLQRSLTNMLGVVQDPDTQQVLQAMLIMNQEGEGLGDIREYYRRRLVSLGVVPPTEEDRKRLAEAEKNTPPDPNAKLAEAMAIESEAKAAKAVAETEETAASTDLKKAQTLETLSNIDRQDQASAMEMSRSMQQEIRPVGPGEYGG